MPASKKIGYAIHPQGTIGFMQLVRLYRVPPRLCVLWDYDRPETYYGRDPEDYVHLHMQLDNDYTLSLEVRELVEGSGSDPSSTPK